MSFRQRVILASVMAITLALVMSARHLNLSPLSSVSAAPSRPAVTESDAPQPVDIPVLPVPALATALPAPEYPVVPAPAPISPPEPAWPEAPAAAPVGEEAPHAGEGAPAEHHERGYSISTRDFLVGSHDPDPEYRAVGFLLFSARANSKLRGHYKYICESYLQHFEPSGSYGADSRPYLRPTYWLLTKAVKKFDCAILLSTYNYARAHKLLSSFNLLGKKGPILVAYPADAYPATDHLLVLDLSGFSDDSVDDSFDIWAQHISYEADAWNDDMMLDRIRLTFKSVLQRYGDSAMYAWSTVIKPAAKDK